MRAKSLLVAVVAATLGLMAGAAAGQPVDQKALPGSICVPANPNQAGDFRYRSGAIRNVGTATRNVECPILRDGFFGDDDRVEQLNVFIQQPNGGRTRCRVSITDVRNGDDQRTRGGSGSRSGRRTEETFTRSTSRSGDRRFVFGAFELSDTSIVHLRCELAPQTRIRGIIWEERLETDQDEGFGAIKGP